MKVYAVLDMTGNFVYNVEALCLRMLTYFLFDHQCQILLVKETVICDLVATSIMDCLVKLSFVRLCFSKLLSLVRLIYDFLE